MKVKHTQRHTVRGTRRRVVAGTLAVGALALVTAGCAYPAASTDHARTATVIVECRSGVVTDGDIRTSARSVRLVDAADVGELAEGCRVVP